MKVGVISDTHLAGSGLRMVASKIIHKVNGDEKKLQETIYPHFRDVDAIIHAGDLVDLSVLKMLESFCEVYAVAGNMDPAEVRDSIPPKRIVELAGFKIGVIHGSGSPNGLAQRVLKEFGDEAVNCIVFGHSHHPYNQVEGGVLLFNPGSATDRRFAPKRTIGILHLGEKITGEHIELE
jgi:uncharacterized protein